VSLAAVGSSDAFFGMEVLEEAKYSMRFLFFSRPLFLELAGEAM
jgi:hypothetical protein